MLPFKILRYVVAYVFIISGLMKVFSPELGHYFISLGLPYPQMMLYAVAFIEVIAGGFLLCNIATKLATIPLMAIMIAALIITKVPILTTDVLKFAFEARLDITMFVLLFLLYRSETS
ncbi:DoxX family protein [Lederbergia sp. NSJ-179]|uniref:DoxX family protein n=1 Tax=Lederbergia sp. NSJ-179 TaxID=2931402 RepID=UPI001FD1BBB8|nr:DoxX family protein [Lederbergia sp. NSJ-179]MCJ7840932.1 DoxX family protein [Lederbergia sp. NSJ-179]